MSVPRYAMVRWTDVDVSENLEKSWLWRHCRRAIYWLLRSPSQTCHAKPKTQINRRRTLPASFPLVGCLPQAAWPERLSLRKVRTLWHCSRLRSVALYLWLIVVISVRRWPLQQYLASLPGAGYGQFEHKADSLIAKFKEAGGTVNWCMSSHRDYHSGYLHHRLPVVDIVVLPLITPLPTKPGATKYWGTGKLANAAITDMQMRQRDVAALDAKYTKELWC